MSHHTAPTAGTRAKYPSIRLAWSLSLSMSACPEVGVSIQYPGVMELSRR